MPSRKALEQDWRAEVSDGVVSQVRDILDSQNSLFGDQRAEQLEALRGETAGYPLWQCIPRSCD